ncbi:probable serine hydrolase [Atheta coriaria]|uniref:probable serine hydrolase n=1 Tax=Dalotia coriaria TaxID=877792 RepID=UPI0031F34B63
MPEEMENAAVNGQDANKVISTMKYQEITIPVPWGHISGKWWGPTDKQPILAIHGWQDNAGTFDMLAPLIAVEGIPVLCVDLPGHGHSSPFPTGMYYYLFWDGLQIVSRIKTHYKWSKLRFIGHSLGGIISFMYASSFPDEVESFTCIDIASPAVVSPSSVVDKIGRTVSQFLKYETLPKELQPSYDYEEMVNTAVAGYNGSCTREAVEILLKRGMRPVAGNKYVFTRDLRLKAMGLAMIGIDEAMAMAKRITCRVLNIRCEPGMKLANPEYYEMVMEELAKNATLERHTVPGMHHLHLNDAASIAPIVIDFLQAGK